MESVIDHIFRPLRQFFTRTVFYIVSCEYYVRALESEARWLKSRHDDMRRKVSLAERHGMEPTNQVCHWMDSVASLLLRADEIVAEFPLVGERGRRAAYRLSARADEARAEAVTLLEQGSPSALQRVADEPVFVRTEVLPETTTLIGLDALLARLQGAFEQDAGSIIGIYGMPGVGKTTLLHHFNNTFLSDVAVSMDIHLVIYVEVTELCSTAAVQDAIGARLGLRWGDRRTTKEKALSLCTYLHKWNFVLLLDDVWEPLNLAEVGVPVPGRQGRSKVLLTTRFEQVCDQMDVATKIKVRCLAGNYPWELFQHKVGNVLTGDTRPLAQAMAERCGGLPLALIAVARAMACKRLTQEWEHGMTVLNLAPWQLEGFEASLLATFKRSYDRLPRESLKSCLLYSSLFTGDMFKESLVECLIGEGFVIDFTAADDMDSLYNKGHYMLGILVTSSLLEAGGDDYHVKMHPMVRAMALWVATDCGNMEDKCLVRTSLSTSSAPPARKWVNAERVSLTRTDIRELKEAPTCSFLRTLLLQSNRFLGRICHGFFGFMPCLRLLDLSDTQLTTLPSEINLLVTLQYLCLSNTIIRSLPDGLGALVNLRFLLLSNVPLQSIAVGVLNPLTALQVLCMDHCYSSWTEVNTCELESGGGSRKRRRQPRQGVNLRELEILKSLHILDVAVQEKHSLHKLSQSPHLTERLRNLHIKDCSDIVDLWFSPSGLWRRMSRLKCINVTGCSNLEKVFFSGGEYIVEEICSSDSVADMIQLPVPNKPIDITNRSYIRATAKSTKKNTARSKSLDRAKPVALLPSLQTIILHDLPKAKIIWQRGRLQHLCSLNISSCNGLQQLVSFSEDRNMPGDGTSSRQPLTEAEVIFPNLKELDLQDLPNLKSISPECSMIDFPNLEEFKVIRCDNLKKLKLVAGSLKELQCTQSWWNKLEWDDENHNSSFLSSVKNL